MRHSPPFHSPKVVTNTFPLHAIFAAQLAGTRMLLRSSTINTAVNVSGFAGTSSVPSHVTGRNEKNGHVTSVHGSGSGNVKSMD